MAAGVNLDAFFPPFLYNYNYINISLILPHFFAAPSSSS